MRRQEWGALLLLPVPYPAPGPDAVQARRSGTDWYVGAMNGTEGRDIVLDTSAFTEKGKKYKVEIYTDDPSLKTRTNVRSTVKTVKGGKPMKLSLLPSGGAALRFVPID